MSLAVLAIVMPHFGAPRVSGDEPFELILTHDQRLCSPRERG
nr:hypothetical protein HMPREF0276_1786 [Corynebacterium accolens ATCC 49725]